MKVVEEIKSDFYPDIRNQSQVPIVSRQFEEDESKNYISVNVSPSNHHQRNGHYKGSPQDSY
jgi:hypothetical protein